MFVYVRMINAQGQPISKQKTKSNDPEKTEKQHPEKPNR